MKPTIKLYLPAMLLLAMSCKKESNTFRSEQNPNKNSAASFVTDYAPGKYSAVKIGTQRWMDKNLEVSRYRNGDKIPQVTDPTKWAKLTTGAWCWYNNDSTTGAVYGKLYNWYAVNDPRGLAPTGWHVSSDAEWDTLAMHLANHSGGKLKDTGTIEAGTGLWYKPNSGATNKTGFTGLPSGRRDFDGVFGNLGYGTFFWTSSEYAIDKAYAPTLGFNSVSIYRGIYGKRDGFSVRCVKD